MRLTKREEEIVRRACYEAGGYSKSHDNCARRAIELYKRELKRGK